MARTCLFCGGGPTTKEHVIPQWLSRSLRERRGARAFHMTTKRATWVSDVFNLEVRAVCRQCNNLFLSAIESEAKPALEHLVFEGGQPIAATSAEQHSLAVWGYKTALLLIAWHGLELLPPQPFRHFRQTTAPGTQGVVWIASRVEGSGAFGPYRVDGGRIRQEGDDSAETNSFSVLFAVGPVVFRVFSHFGDLTLALNDEPLKTHWLRIWPSEPKPDALKTLTAEQVDDLFRQR